MGKITDEILDMCYNAAMEDVFPDRGERAQYEKEHIERRQAARSTVGLSTQMSKGAAQGIQRTANFQGGPMLPSMPNMSGSDSGVDFDFA